MAAVTKIGKQPEDILCTGQRFPGAWQHLAGYRVAPYHCRIGDQALELKAKVRLTGNHGKVFENYTRAAMKNAKNFSQTNLTWKWTTEPPAPKK